MVDKNGQFTIYFKNGFSQFSVDRIKMLLQMGQNVTLKYFTPKIRGMEITSIFVDEAKEFKCQP